MTDTSQRPEPIRTDASNAFAKNTMRVRIPAIIREIQALNPDLPAPMIASLDRLHDESAGDAVIRPLSRPAPHYDDCAEAYPKHAGGRWLETYWFVAGTY